MDSQDTQFLTNLKKQLRILATCYESLSSRSSKLMQNKRQDPIRDKIYNQLVEKSEKCIQSIVNANSKIAKLDVNIPDKLVMNLGDVERQSQLYQDSIFQHCTTEAQYGKVVTESFQQYAKELEEQLDFVFKEVQIFDK